MKVYRASVGRGSASSATRAQKQYLTRAGFLMEAFTRRLCHLSFQPPNERIKDPQIHPTRPIFLLLNTTHIEKSVALPPARWRSGSRSRASHFASTQRSRMPLLCGATDASRIFAVSGAITMKMMTAPAARRYRSYIDLSLVGGLAMGCHRQIDPGHPERSRATRPPSGPFAGCEACRRW